MFFDQYTQARYQDAAEYVYQRMTFSADNANLAVAKLNDFLAKPEDQQNQDVAALLAADDREPGRKVDALNPDYVTYLLKLKVQNYLFFKNRIIN